jgi:hypothetical protein
MVTPRIILSDWHSDISNAYSIEDGDSIYIRLLKGFLGFPLWYAIRRSCILVILKVMRVCDKPYSNKDVAKLKRKNAADFYSILSFLVLAVLYSYVFLTYHNPTIRIADISLRCFIPLFLIYLIWRHLELLGVVFALQILTNKPSGSPRALIYVFIDYMHIVLIFSIYYMSYGIFFSDTFSKCGNGIFTDFVSPVYFSFVTITTLGYGDLKPVYRLGKALTILELLFGVLLLVVVIQSVMKEK